MRHGGAAGRRKGALARLIRLLLDNVCIVAEFLQRRRNALQPVERRTRAVSFPRISTESEFSRIESARCHTRSNAAFTDSTSASGRVSHGSRSSQRTKI